MREKRISFFSRNDSLTTPRGKRGREKHWKYLWKSTWESHRENQSQKHLRFEHCSCSSMLPMAMFEI